MSKKLSLTKKLLISNILYGIPVLVLMVLMVNAKSKDISFAQYEKYGNEYQRPLENLLENISKHKLAALRALAGEPAGKTEMATLEGQITQSLEAVEAVDKKLGETLQFTDEGLSQRKRENFRISLVKKKWDALKEKISSAKPEESNESHASLIGDIRGMISHLGDTSNLILDPDLDSYYLMDVTLVALPQTQDRIQEITTYMESVLQRRKIAPGERIQANTYATLLKTIDLDHVSASTQTALNEDKNFYGTSESLQRNVPKGLEEAQASIGALAELTKKISEAEQVSVSPESYLEASAKAMSASYSYWHACVQELDRLLQARIDTFKAGRLWSILLGLLALGFAVGVSWYIGAGLKKSLSQAVVSLTKSATTTNSSSSELVDTAQALSSSSSEQAAAIQETSATLDQINAMVNKSLDNASKSAEVADTSHKTATAGKASVEEMIRAIGEINSSNEGIVNQINESNQQISEIVKIINEIGTKTKVINDIVFQTKLLSFNASVEAARAGEHGKGFAVVAEEVGNLAQMSGNAAKEISGMLDASMHKVTSIVEETKGKVDRLVTLCKSKVDAGTQVAHRCGSSLEEIVRTVDEVNTMMREISSAAEEQAKGVNEITKAMQLLDQATQQNAMMSSKTANHAEALSKQAEDLRVIVSTIEEEVLGQSSPLEFKIAQTHLKEKNNVIPIKNIGKKEKKTAYAQSPLKKAAGGAVAPSSDDPRFEDV